MTKRKRKTTKPKPKSRRKPTCLVKGVAVERGKVYKIKHRKKGDLVVQVLKIMPTEKEDLADDFMVFCRYDVRAGTTQVSLSMAPGKINVRESGLRPSHILVIEELVGASWKVPVDKKLAKAQTKKGGPGFFTQITNLVKGGN